jgi:uncharacterized protein YbjQ (UPF0145 family)
MNMANCVLCGEKIGIFEGNSIHALKGDYRICNSCNNMLNRLENGDAKAYIELQPFIENTTDEVLKNYLKSVGDCDDEEISKVNRELEIKLKTKEFETLSSQNSNIITLSTGYSFEGYKITQYINIISGECVLGTGFLSETGASLSDIFGIRSTTFSNKLKEAKDWALHQLKLSCYLQGGNAIVGIDFDYITFSNNMIGVVASGTAVIIEQIV